MAEDNKLENKKEEGKKGKNKFKFIIGLGLIIVLAIYIPKIINPNLEKVTTISKASLENVLKINDLSTFDYTYNAVTDVKDDKDKIKYHVSYEGLVTLGIDFSKIDISVDEEKKEISIILPNAQVQDISIDAGTMDYIFENKKYETETVSQESYKASVEDLKKRVDKQESLLEIANYNAITAVKALIEPWVNQLDGQYEVEVKTNEE